MSKAFDDIQERELHQLELMQENAIESCMTSFWLIHSFLQVLSYDESKSKRVSERAFMTLFGQDNETFTSTMFLNLDQLQRQLDKDEFQGDKSMAAFWVIENQFQKFIEWQYFMDYDSQMTEKFFAEYTRIKMQTQKSKIDSGSALDVVSSQALDANLVVMESNGTESGMHDTSSSSGNYITYVVDANIRPVNDQVPFAKFASQVDVINDLSKPITPHYVPKVREPVFVKPHHVIASGSSRNSSNESFRSNDMAYKYYLEFASQVDVINDLSKPVTPHYVPKVREHVFVKPHHVIASGSSRNSSNESFRSNDMAHKYYLEVNSRAKVQSLKTRNINKPVEPKSHTQKPDRQIAIGQRFSLNKSFAVHEKPNAPRSCLRWIPTGRIFKTAGLRWIPTGNMFIDRTTKVDSEPPNGLNEYITNPYECKQSLDVSACTLNLSAVHASDLNVNKMASADNTSGLTLQRKERCTLQCALSLEEEKSSCLRPFSSTSFMVFHARSVIKTMTTANQGMSVEKIEHIVTQRVANAIEAIPIYESINQTKQRKNKVAGNASNKIKWECDHNESSSQQQNKEHKGFAVALAVLKPERIKVDKARIDEGEPAGSIALGAATAVKTRETARCGGLKYSSNSY
nr:hypothetical protein [Tanacetum cinerariifolium]